MIRVVSFFFVLIITISCSESAFKQLNDLEKGNLKGNISSIATFEYKATTKFGEVQKGEANEDMIWTNNIKTFNSLGNIKEHLIFYGLTPIVHQKYTYNVNNKIDFVDDYQDSFNTITENTPLNTKTIYKYDNLKQLVSKNTYYEDGSVMNKKEFFYNNKGQITKSFDKLNNSEYEATPYKYEYEKNTKTIKHYSPSDTNKLLGYQVFLEHNLMEYFNIHDATTTYTRDKNGNITNKLIKLDEKNVEMNFKSHYEYDEKGNWIIKIDSALNFPSSITYREINYVNDNLTSLEVFKNSKALKDYKNDLKLRSCSSENVLKILMNDIKFDDFDIEKNTIKILSEYNCEFEVAMTIQSTEFRSIRQKIIGIFKFIDDEYQRFTFSEDLTKRDTY